MARPFSALQELGDGTRLSVFLSILGIRKNVSQIVAELGLAQPQVSYHLRKLKDAGLAVEEKDGRWVWYQANWDTRDPNLRDLIELMASWVGDTGAIGGAGTAAAGDEGAGGHGEAGHQVAAERPGSAAPGVRPVVERPKKRDSDLDDFML